MNWEKLKPNHYFNNPGEYIYTSTIFDLKEYDKLYENQKNLSHQSWKDFYQKYKTRFKLRENFKEVDFSGKIICLWFFKERSNSTASYVQLNGKNLRYSPNTFLITPEKDISFIETKRKYIRNPLVQLDISEKLWNKLIERLNKFS